METAVDEGGRLPAPSLGQAHAKASSPASPGSLTGRVDGESVPVLPSWHAARGT